LYFGNQRLLEDLYVPLTVTPVAQDLADPDKESIKITRFDSRLLPKHKRVLITDTAGMGKSTLLKFLLLPVCKVMLCHPDFYRITTLVRVQIDPRPH
jgi:hypothetical protein